MDSSTWADTLSFRPIYRAKRKNCISTKETNTLTLNQEHYPQIPANHFRWTHASLTALQCIGLHHKTKHLKSKNKNVSRCFGKSLTLGWARRGKATLGSICAQTEKEREMRMMREKKQSHIWMQLPRAKFITINPFTLWEIINAIELWNEKLRAWMGHTRRMTLTLWLVILLIWVCAPSAEGVQTERIIRETISCSSVTLSCHRLNTDSYKEEFQTISYSQT